MRDSDVEIMSACLSVRPLRSGIVCIIAMAYFTTIVTLLFDENDIFISLESSIHALQDGCSISVGYKI